MTRSGRLRDLLMGGDRRSIGRVDEVLELVLGQPKRVGELAKLLWDSDAVVRMRAADALEKISRERPEWIENFKDEIPHYNARHNAKPGITGWAQVKGFRGDTDLGERIRADLFYLENWNVLLDFQVMIMTFFNCKNAG